MTLAWPWALAVVPAVVAIAAWAVWWSRRRSAAGGLPHPNLDILDAVGVAPRRRRLIPLALALVATLMLAVGLARPHAEREVPRDRATIMLAIDVSGSMAAADVRPNRLRAAQDAALTFADRMPRTFQVGLVAFSGTASVIVPPTTDRAQLRRGVESLLPLGGTAIGEALVSSTGAIRQAQGGVTVPDAARILLLSDGANSSGVSVEEALGEVTRAGIPVYTVALGTPEGRLSDGRPVPPSPEALAAIAEATGGDSFESQDAASVSSIYEHLGEFIGTVREQREVTDWPVAAALLLFAAAGLAWLRWGVRWG